MLNETFSSITERLENERDEAYVKRLLEESKKYSNAAKAFYEPIAATVRDWAASLVGENESMDGASDNGGMIAIPAPLAIGGTFDAVMVAMCKGIKAKALKDNLFITSTKSGADFLFEVESPNASGKVQAKANVHSKDGKTKQALELIHKAGRRRFEQDTERERQTWVNLSACTGWPMDVCEILSRAAEAGIYAEALKSFAEAEKLNSIKQQQEQSQEARNSQRLADVVRAQQAENAETAEPVQVAELSPVAEVAQSNWIKVDKDEFAEALNAASLENSLDPLDKLAKKAKSRRKLTSAALAASV